MIVLRCYGSFLLLVYLLVIEIKLVFRGIEKRFGEESSRRFRCFFFFMDCCGVLDGFGVIFIF